MHNFMIYKNDKVTIFIDNSDNKLNIGIDGYYKTNKLIFLIAIFIILVFIVSGYNGIKSLTALLITLVIIFLFMTDFVLKGYSPIFLAIICSFVITFITLIIVSGFNFKTYAAIIGTLGGVTSAGLLGYFSILNMRLSGFSEHEAMYLQNAAGQMDFQGILASGIIIGALGAVMDVCISISSSIFEIKKANNNYSFYDLFKSGMKIGRDIIGTMVNTLVLAYSGSSFTLILLFAAQKSDFPLGRIINLDFITSELARSIAGSCGMVLAIPITAFSAAFLVNLKKNGNKI